MMYIYSKINIPSITTNKKRENYAKEEKRNHQSTIYFSEVHIDIWRERETETERDRETDRKTGYLKLSTQRIIKKKKNK